MRGFIVVRTFIAGLLLPGLGFVLVNRLRLGLLSAALYFLTVAFFSLSRAVLAPTGYYAMTVCVIVIVLVSASHAALVAHRASAEKAISQQWKKAAGFAGIFIGLAFLPWYDQATYLGYESFDIPSNSMAPTLVAGDYILSDAWHYDENEPNRGDLVVFITPTPSYASNGPHQGDSVTYVKRVVGLPGDEIIYERHRLTINGETVKTKVAEDATPSVPRFVEQLNDSWHDILITNPSFSIKDGTYHVPDEHYFLMGDNRDNTRDSRFIGPVPRDNLRGRVAHIWYSSTSEFPVIF